MPVTKTVDSSEALQTARWALEHAIADLAGADTPGARITIGRCKDALGEIAAALQAPAEPDICWPANGSIADAVDWDHRDELYTGDEDVVEVKCAVRVKNRYLAEVVTGGTPDCLDVEIRDFATPHEALDAYERAEATFAEPA